MACSRPAGEQLISAQLPRRARLRVVADAAITDLGVLAGEWCELHSMPGREITLASVEGADALLVRSVTPVNADLLANGSIKFVGTATIGTDHIDTALLRERSIGFAYAPGCNANAVVDYVLATLLAEYSWAQLAQKSIGIVGCGNVGRRLLAALAHFGLRSVVYDPLLDLQACSEKFDARMARSLDEILLCDIISLHVPLTRDGQHPTWHMFDRERLVKLAVGTLLINTSRGAVVDNAALLQLASGRDDLCIALDVWECEPRPDAELVARANYATPHIAGYSSAGKLRGTYMIANAMREFFTKNQTGGYIEMPATLPAKPLACIDINALSPSENFADRLAKICPLRQQSGFFKAEYTSANPAQRGQVFDRQRRDYRLRDEFDYAKLL